MNFFLFIWACSIFLGGFVGGLEITSHYMENEVFIEKVPVFIEKKHEHCWERNDFFYYPSRIRDRILINGPFKGRECRHCGKREYLRKECKETWSDNP